MEVMEDGNLMDKVLILIQRDMEYYNGKQTILQETICPGVTGGRLDFPRSASFASIKLVLWWEDEYLAAYRKNSGFLSKFDSSDQNQEGSGACGGIVKASDPSKFVNLINKSAEELLEHLHVLTQEALDHADLTVLTGTIGAAALLKNCLWFYIQSLNEIKGNHTDTLQNSFKKYQEMVEALAERLLDLHCRLLSLYILQEAESLDWENQKAFCESERGSYVMQMWWLYMQSTREDLWNSVPPKMAQRVFAGMLNESLTILTVRYTQARASQARSQLLAVDISNLLLCVAQILPSICENAEEFIAFNLNNKSKILRDIHTKCQELLVCLILRGASLDILQKVFRKENSEIFKSRGVGPAVWITFALPNIFKEQVKNLKELSDIPADILTSLEVMVLLAQPQANWALLLKVLTMKNCKILKFVLEVGFSNNVNEMVKETSRVEPCGIFLCPGDGTCRNVEISEPTMTDSQYYNLIYAASVVILTVGNAEDFTEVLIPFICKEPDWAKCFDRRHVWNQIRPPWYEAILDMTKSILPTIVKTVINAIQTGASTYQAMFIVLASFSQLWDSIDKALPIIASILQDILPADIIPLGNSTLIQIIIAALYSELLRNSEVKSAKEVHFSEKEHRDSMKSFEGILGSPEEIALAVAESLCSIDEDNKHTDQIEEFLEQVKENLDFFNDTFCEGAKWIESSKEMSEVLVSDILMNSRGKTSLKAIYNFVKSNSEWMFQKLGISEHGETCVPNKLVATPSPLLYTMFHIGYRSFDQLLMGKWHPKWIDLLQAPLGLNAERVWCQISQRWEFQDVNIPSLPPREVQIVNNVTAFLKQI